GTFYKKRAARILPPYLLSVFVITLAWAIPTDAFGSVNKCLTDFFSTLSFTQTFFPTALLDNKINGVLWTAAVEVQFYLIFPFLAYCFRRKPLLSYAAMLAIAAAYIHGFALRNEALLRMTVNQLPAFFAVFANGMLAAYAWVWLSGRVERRAWLSALATLAAVGCLILIGHMEKTVTRVDPVQVWQLRNRFALSLALVAFLFSAALSARWFRWLFSNRVMRFCAAISYNIYIWHQWLAVRFVEWRIPGWSGEMRPNMAGNRPWQWGYTLLVTFASFAVAALLTYGFEKPILKKLLAPRAPEMEEYDETVPI
ncbi:MAG: acyltransferase, partial [Clostridia bacterium]|nr:acyltransferase [Clostridia bacterium]